MKERAKELDDGEGVLVLVDLLGGSPCNVTASCLKQEGLECVTGLNLPMLISLLEEREDGTLRSMPKVAMEAGKTGIVNVKQLIG